MSKCWQLGALMKKNLILMKRSCCATCTEVLFPIILMILLVMVRRAVKSVEYSTPIEDVNFTLENSTAIIENRQMISALQSGSNNWNGLKIRNPM